jgi:hypothetical protein
MKRYLLPVALVLTIMLSSTAGCIGLIPAREGLEAMRGEARASVTPDIKTISHVFDTIELEPYINSTTLDVRADATQIIIYRKVSITGSDTIACFDGGITRYVKATLTNPAGVVEWELDECQDVQPATVEINPDPTLAVGAWTLDVEARGIGVGGTAAQDQFTFTVTVLNTCIIYPPNEEC